MKAEAPEKLYIKDTDIHLSIYSLKGSEDEVEYTRTDAFIEKAENYLRNKCQRFILTEKNIEDFVNYMKGGVRYGSKER